MDIIEFEKAMEPFEYSKIRGGYRIDSVKVGDIRCAVIPEGVVGIRFRAFEGCRELREVYLPDGVRFVSFSAFADCKSLAVVRVPESLSDIDDGAFEGCDRLEYNCVGGCKYLGNEENPYVVLFSAVEGLRTAAVADGTRTVNRSAFHACRDTLESVTLPRTVEVIGERAFCKCTRLSEIELPSGLKEIGDSAFLCCDSLIRVEIPEGVERIDDSAFGHCRSLEEIVSHSESYKSVDGVLYADEGTTLLCYPAGRKEKEFRIPKEVDLIERYAFFGAHSLYSVTLPESVCDINEGAFSGCDNLNAIYVEEPEGWYETPEADITGSRIDPDILRDPERACKHLLRGMELFYQYYKKNF